MVTLDKWILVRPMGWTNDWFNGNTMQKSNQCTGKITSCPRTNEAWVTVETQFLWFSVFVKQFDKRFDTGPGTRRRLPGGESRICKIASTTGWVILGGGVTLARERLFSTSLSSNPTAKIRFFQSLTQLSDLPTSVAYA